MLDYQALSALAAVAREGTFDRAAASLGVTPSAVSQRVRGLEERLGTVLIVRGHPCTPTEAGARICAHVERVRLLEGEAVSILPLLASAGTPGESPATVRIAVNADSLGTWLLPALAAFAGRTGALIDLVVEGEGQTADRLRSGEVVAALTADPKPIQGCRTVSIGSLRYVATATPLFATRYFHAAVDAAAIARAPVVRFGREDFLQARWASDVAGASLSTLVNFVPTTQGFVEAVLAGLGWGMNPLLLVKDHLASGRLIELVPGRFLDIPLYWQHARLGKTLLTALTCEVEYAARRWLI